VLHPKEDYAYSAAYESSDEGVATVDANGTLTVVADGETTISVTVTRDFDGEFIVNSVPLEVDITAGSSIDYLETLDGSAGKSFVTGLAARISGQDPVTAKPRFSTRDLGTKTFTRNADFLGIGLAGLSAISPNNSRGQNTRAGTAITKRHILCTAHYPLNVGDTIDFVEDAGGAKVAVTKTIVQAKTHPLYAGQSGNYCYDVQICLLDSDLPPEIDIMEVLPSDAGDYCGEYNWVGSHGCAFDQNQSGSSTLHGILSDGYYFGASINQHFFSHITPSSMPLGVNYNPLTLGYSSPSDHFSPHLVLETDDLYKFSRRVTTGDSGAPHCFVLGSKLLLVGLNTSPVGGVYLPNVMDDINQLIEDVDTLQGDITGYTVTEGDLSSFPTYP
jgi:hypothetical protein